MINPLVSVIVPVYNVEQYLRKCLDSLINQSLKEIEIICVNDASPDNSIDILEEYAEKDERIVIVNLEKNLCLGGARNIGINKAKSLYVGFVDSDDFVDLNMYEKLYYAAIKENADIVNCDYYEYKGENRINRVDKYNSNIFYLPKYEMNKYFILREPSAWHNLYRKELFVKNNLYFPEHTFYEDCAIMSPLFLLAEKIIKVDCPLYFYRLNNYSICRRSNDYRFYERMNGAKIFLSNMKKYNYFNKYMEETEFLFTKLFYLNTIWGSLVNFTPIEEEYIDKIKKEMKLYFPKFSKNKYYKNRSITKRDLILRIISLNTKLGVVLFSIVSKIVKNGK